MTQDRQYSEEDLSGFLTDEATIGSVGMVLGGIVEDSHRLILRLDDLIEDDNGEVVLFNDSHVPSLALETDSRVIARGEMQGHTTAAGEDVSGFHFMSFDNGVTIYFRDGLDLVLVAETIASG